MNVDQIRIDHAARRVFRDGEELLLPPLQYDLLAYFASRAGRLCTRGMIVANVWAESPDLSPRSVDVAVSKLRRELEDHEGRPRYLRTVWSHGWLLELSRLADFETPTVAIDGAVYSVVRWETGPMDGEDRTFILHARQVPDGC